MTNYYTVVGVTHTNMYTCSYKFVVNPNSYLIKGDWDKMPYVLSKIRMQEDTIIRVFGIRYHTF